ncbi:hypothetical protein I7I51_03739 [Histoplasma capsulatum]|uniref:Uncharacterized protein n=1 Tax=Ajellomyces capsulatus TaxID=5037 RepID=A0A8A1MAP8_AJECA|nr:hypothetical protein I7I51_03739 [Histoplasma capsulatum]
MRSARNWLECPPHTPPPALFTTLRVVKVVVLSAGRALAVSGRECANGAPPWNGFPFVLSYFNKISSFEIQRTMSRLAAIGRLIKPLYLGKFNGFGPTPSEVSGLAIRILDF